MTDKAPQAAVYLRIILAPLARLEDRENIQIDYEDEERAIDDIIVPVCVFRVAVPAGSVGFLAGRQGATADAARILLRAWAGTAGWRKRLDIWICSQ